MNLPFPLLLDGGLASQLEAKGYDLNHPLWSAHILKEDPEAIYQVHLDFLRSGADIITSSSYQASFPGFAKIGIEREEATILIKKSVELAIAAREDFLREAESKNEVWVAASVGPYGAYLADGSEYRGNYQISSKELRDFHKERMEILLETEADFFACETIPSLKEAIILAELVEKYAKQSWISFSCKDGLHTNEGQKLSTCLEVLKNYSNVFAVGINCTSPQYIPSLIEEIKASETAKRIILYPNSGESYHPENKSWSGNKPQDEFCIWTRRWLDAGADILGGCCRILPAHIQALKKLI